MILYFSAEGNSRYVAQRIAEATGDAARSIEELAPAGPLRLELEPGEQLGVVSPTYFWELPRIVAGVLGRLALDPDPERYTFFVATYGTTPGRTGVIVKGLLKRRGIRLDARFAVRMPDTWTPIFDLSDPDRVTAQLARADRQASQVAEKIAARERGSFMPLRTPAIARPVAHAAFLAARRTSRFRVLDACVGCGLCERTCPAGAIRIEEGRPVWVKGSCELCLGCLHRCPTFAIRYGSGSATGEHGQYLHPSFKKAR